MRAALLLLLLCIAGCPTEPPPPDDDDATADDDDATADDDDSAGDDDDSTPADADGDGVPAPLDCDDEDPAVFPGAVERCNGADDDCDGFLDPPAPWCIRGPADCALPSLGAAIPPLVHLPFASTDPTANLGTLPPEQWVIESWSGAIGPGAHGDGAVFVRNPVDPNNNPQLKASFQPAWASPTFTVAAWIRPTFGTDRTVIVNTLWDSDYLGFSFEWAWGSLALRLGDGSAVATFPVPWMLDRWAHVAASFDGEQVTLFIDGRVVDRRPLPDSFGGYAGTPYSRFIVGGYQNAYAYAYEGVIDEVMYWDSALSEEQLRRVALPGWGLRFEDDGQTCGPVGQARERAGSDPADVVPDVPALGAQVRVEAWIRPDGPGGSIVTRPGAFSLHLDGTTLTGWVTGDDGTSPSIVADLSDRLTLWTPVMLEFDGLHLRLLVRGEERASVLPGFFALGGGDGPVSVGEGFTGGLDEVRVSGVRGRSWEAREAGLTLLLADAMDRTLSQQGVSPMGPLTLDLAGASADVTADDPERAGYELHAETRIPVPHRHGHVTAPLPGPLMGPLTLRAELKHVTAPDDEITLVGTEQAGLRLGPSGLALVVGPDRVEAPGPVSDLWHRVSGEVTADELRLSLDGLVLATTARSTPAPASSRFELASAGDLLVLQSTEGGAERVWLQRAEIVAAVDETARQRFEAPWRLEPHPVLNSQNDEIFVNGLASWLAPVPDDLLWAQSIDPRDESIYHWERSRRAKRLAQAAALSVGTSDEQPLFEAAWTLLDNMDVGTWYWSWGQGGTLRDYSLAYDRLHPLLLAREEADPTLAPLHRRFRRRLLAAAWHISSRGGITEDGFSDERGLYHYNPGNIAANSRLRVLAGTGTLGLALPEARHEPFGTAGELLELTVDDLLRDRGAGGAALGRHQERYHEPSGRYNEGSGYQADVYSVLMPFLTDWLTLGGEDHVTTGPMADLFDVSIAQMMPSGDPALYATGNLTYVPRHPMMALYRPERAALYEWFYPRQFDTSVTGGEPEWTSWVSEDFAALRSGWGGDDLWIGLLGRAVPARGSHTQPDQLSLSMMWDGALLLIDPGDGRDYRPTDPSAEVWLTSEQGHNNVLVDGGGPELIYSLTDMVDPATVTASLLSERADYVRMEGTLGGPVADGGAAHARSVLMLDDRFAVVLDEVDAGSPSEIALQWHLGGPLDSGAGTIESLSGDELVWSTTNPQGDPVGLLVRTLSGPLGATATQATGPTNFLRGDIWDHPYVRVHQTAEQAALLSVLAPYEPAVDAPSVTVSLDDEDARVAAIDGLGIGPVELALNTTGGPLTLGPFLTDGRLTAGHGAEWLLLVDGTTAQRGELAATASCPLAALSMELEQGTLSGALSRSAGPCSLSLARSASPSAVTVDGAPSSGWTWDGSAGAVVLDPAPLTDFLIE